MEKSFLGTTDGGSLYIYGQDQLNDLISKNKDRRCLVTVSFLGEDRRKRILAYYFKVILSSYKDAFRALGVIKTTNQIDSELRLTSPLLEDRNLDDLDVNELIVYIDLVERKGLEDLSLVFQDPRVI